MVAPSSRAKANLSRGKLPIDAFGPAAGAAGPDAQYALRCPGRPLAAARALGGPQSQQACAPWRGAQETDGSDHLARQRLRRVGFKPTVGAGSAGRAWCPSRPARTTAGPISPHGGRIARAWDEVLANAADEPTMRLKHGTLRQLARHVRRCPSKARLAVMRAERLTRGVRAVRISAAAPVGRGRGGAGRQVELPPASTYADAEVHRAAARFKGSSCPNTSNASRRACGVQRPGGP